MCCRGRLCVKANMDLHDSCCVGASSAPAQADNGWRPGSAGEAQWRTATPACPLRFPARRLKGKRGGGHNWSQDAQEYPISHGDMTDLNSCDCDKANQQGSNMSKHLRGRKAMRLAGAPAPKCTTIRLNVPSMLMFIGRLCLLPCEDGCILILSQAVGLSTARSARLHSGSFAASGA